MERQSETSRFKDGRVIALCIGCFFAGFLIAMLIFGAPWHLPPAWGDIPTWITGIATAVLAVFAIVTAWYASQAFRKQSQEVTAIEQQVKDEQALTRQQTELLKIQSGQLDLQSKQLDDQRQANARQAEVLELQASELRESLDQRKREAELRHRDQANRVFIAETRPAQPEGLPSVTAYVKNTSDQPIYDLELRWHLGSAGYGDPNPEPLGNLMPGMETNRTREFPRGTNLAASGAVVTFRDTAGVTWIRRPDGSLVEQQ